MSLCAYIEYAIGIINVGKRTIEKKLMARNVTCACASHV